MLSPVLMREHRNYTTAEISCQEVSRNIFIFFFFSALYLLNTGRVFKSQSCRGRVGLRRGYLRRDLLHVRAQRRCGRPFGGREALPFPDRGYPQNRPNEADWRALSGLLENPHAVYHDLPIKRKLLRHKMWEQYPCSILVGSSVCSPTE